MPDETPPNEVELLKQQVELLKDMLKTVKVDVTSKGTKDPEEKRGRLVHGYHQDKYSKPLEGPLRRLMAKGKDARPLIVHFATYPNLSRNTLYQQVYWGLRHLRDIHAEKEPEFSRFVGSVNLQRRPTGLILMPYGHEEIVGELKVSEVSNQDLYSNGSGVLKAPKEWRSALEDFLDCAPTGEKLVLTDLSLTDEDVARVRLRLRSSEDNQCLVWSVSHLEIECVKLSPEDYAEYKKSNS